jgi:hypothetical protein
MAKEQVGIDEQKEKKKQRHVIFTPLYLSTKK